MDDKAAAAARHECLRPRSFCVMLASFVCNGVIFGVINSYGVIYKTLHEKLSASSGNEASSKASLVGALTIGTTFALSPVAGILVDRYGIRLVSFIGGMLAALGMFLSSLMVDSVVGLCITYGIMLGVGSSLAYTPSLVILGHYFKDYMGQVNGFVTSGSSLFTIIMLYTTDALLKIVNLEGCLQCLGGFMSLIMFCALVFKPVKHEEGTAPPENQSSQRRSIRKRMGNIINVNIWKRKKYVVWTVAVPIALFGYFVPYIHMVKFAEGKFPGADGKILVLSMVVTSGIGRLICGKIADIPKVNRILLQQISFIAIGLLTMLLPLVNDFFVLVVIALAMGLFDGCFISLLGPIAFELCGKNGASQAIGFLLGLCSIPLTAGPPIAGLIYDHTGSYKIPFILAGVPPIVGAMALFFVRCVEKDTTTYDIEQAATSGSKANVANGDCHTEALQPPPPSYKEAVTESEEPAETVPLTSRKSDEPDLQLEEEAETKLNGEIEEDEEAESSLLSEITKAIVLPAGSST